jgi:hypothetical protein
VVDKVLLRILLAVIGNGKGNHHLRGQIGSIGASRIDSCGCAAQKPRSIQIQLFGQQSDSTQRHMVPEGGSTKYACSVFAISEPYASDQNTAIVWVLSGAETRSIACMLL